MGVKPPFLYDAVAKESPLHAFDPKAISRASLIPPAPGPPKPEGPLLKFNRHPDSWFVLPYEKEEVAPMSPNIKTQIKRVRTAQLVLRCFELLAGLGLLASMILISKVQTQTGLLIRIPAGVAIFHALYGVYHLSRKYSGRSAASTASYMFFAACLDVAILPFYAFSALIAESQYQLSSMNNDQDGEWSSLLPAGQELVPKLTGVVFLCAVVGGVFHLVSLGLSLWLAVTYRKIARLPPDMNPLLDEDVDRARARKHRNSTMSRNLKTSLAPSESRITTPLESKRNSGTPYEELGRPPTIPFLATRSSIDSLPSYRSTSPEKNGSPVDLPPRQYIYNHSNTSQTSTTRPGTATSRPNTSKSSQSRSPTRPRRQGQTLTERRDVWLGADSLTLGSKKPAYSRVPQDMEGENKSHETFNDTSAYTYASSRNSLPKPLSSHPSSSPPNFSRRELSPPPRSPQRETRRSILSQINDSPVQSGGNVDVDANAPQPPRHAYNTRQAARAPSPSAYSESVYSESQVSTMSSPQQGVGSPGKPYRGLVTGYGAERPVVVGAERNVSSGNDVGKRSYRRDVSGKIMEEGRGRKDGGWGTRFRKVSGI